jgi:hypothetical protein
MPDQVEVSADGRSSTYTYGKTTPPQLDDLITRALDRMSAEPNPVTAAANLVVRWSESNSEVRDLIPPIVEEFIKRRVAERAQEGTK